MPNPIIKIHNAETGEIVERPMTKEEMAWYKAATAEQPEVTDAPAN